MWLKYKPSIGTGEKRGCKTVKLSTFTVLGNRQSGYSETFDCNTKQSCRLQGKVENIWLADVACVCVREHFWMKMGRARLILDDCKAILAQMS